MTPRSHPDSAAVCSPRLCAVDSHIRLQIGRKIETPADWMEARMEYAKIDPELEALKNVTYDRGDWIKVFLVMIGSLYLGSSTRDPEEVAK